MELRQGSAGRAVAGRAGQAVGGGRALERPGRNLYGKIEVKKKFLNYIRRFILLAFVAGQLWGADMLLDQPHLRKDHQAFAKISVIFSQYFFDIFP